MVITLIASSFQVTTIAIMSCLAFVDPNSNLSKLVIHLVVKKKNDTLDFNLFDFEFVSPISYVINWAVN